MKRNKFKFFEDKRYTYDLGFPGNSVVKNLPANERDTIDMVQSLDQEDSLEEEMATHSVFLSEKFHGQKSLVGYSPRGHKESDTTKQLRTYIHTHARAHTHTHTHL